MSIEPDDPFVDNRLERARHVIATWMAILRDVALTALAIIVAATSWSVWGASNEVKGAAVEERAFLRTQNDVLVQDHTKISAMLADGQEIVAEAKLAVPALKNAATSLPGAAVSISRAARSASEASAVLARQTPVLLGNANETMLVARTDLHRQFEDLHTISGHVDQGIQTLNALGVDIRGFVARDDVELHRLLAGFADLTAAAIPVVNASGQTIGELHTIVANGAKLSEWAVEKVIGSPYHPTGNAFVRAMKRAGHYAGQFVLTNLGTIVLVLRFIGAGGG